MPIIKIFYTIIAGTLLYTMPMWTYLSIFQNSGNHQLSVLSVLLGSVTFISVAYVEHQKDGK